jgi:hypothetical protein
MVEIKPNLRKNNDTQNPRQQNQAVVSRIIMGYTRLTKAYRLDNSPHPQWARYARPQYRSLTSYGNAASSDIDINENNMK